MKTAGILILGSVFYVLTGCQSEQSQVADNAASTRQSDTVADFPILPLERLMAPGSFGTPLISPDGRLISWIAPLDGISNLYVAPAHDIAAARPVTRFTEGGVRGTNVSGKVIYRWHYDSRRVIFPMDYDGDENWDIHIVDVETGEERNLTPVPDKKVEIIAYGRAKPDDVLVSVVTFGQTNPDVYHLNLASGEFTLVQKNEGSLAYLADSDLKIRLSISFSDEGGLDVYQFSTAPEAGGRGELIYQVAPDDLPAHTTAVYQGIIRFDASGEHLYIYDAQGRDKAALVTVDLETGELNLLAEDDRVDIGGVIYHPTKATVQAYATNWIETEWTAIDPEIEADLEALAQIKNGELSVLSRSEDDSKWIVQYMSSDEPVSFYLYDRESKSGQFLFTSTPQLEGLKLSRMHPYVLTTDDGFDLVSYITLPPWTDPDDDGRPDQPVPIVVYVHGGPSDERAQVGFGALVHWLANRGYGFLYVNFRGSAGFGKAYMNAQKMEWGGKMHQDVLDQVQWAIDEGIADPDKVAILGGSYGGYEALVGMTITPDIFACGIAIVGPSNLEIFMPHWDEDRMGKIIGDPRTKEGRAFLRSRSPINFAQNTKNPVLIGQGARDSRVPQEQSDTVVEKMQQAGVEVTYIVYPDEGHGFAKPANNMSFYAITEVFLGQCLGGRYEPIDVQIEGSSVQVPVGAEHIPGLNEALATRVEIDFIGF
jgi:dipeptidyl aminopeptidase/acylaminoacyl peptidase